MEVADRHRVIVTKSDRSSCDQPGSVHTALAEVESVGGGGNSLAASSGRRSLVLMPSTPSAYPQVVSRRFVCLKSAFLQLKGDFWEGFDSRQLHQREGPQFSGPSIFGGFLSGRPRRRGTTSSRLGPALTVTRGYLSGLL